MRYSKDPILTIRQPTFGANYCLESGDEAGMNMKNNERPLRLDYVRHQQCTVMNNIGSGTNPLWTTFVIDCERRHFANGRSFMSLWDGQLDSHKQQKRRQSRCEERIKMNLKTENGSWKRGRVERLRRIQKGSGKWEKASVCNFAERLGEG